jgi:hypothetical protein
MTGTKDGLPVDTTNCFCSSDKYSLRLIESVIFYLLDITFDYSSYSIYFANVIYFFIICFTIRCF